MGNNYKFEMPVEHLRRLKTNLYNYKKTQTGYDKKIYVASLKYIPHSILKLIENIPMPWNTVHIKKVIYHNSGSIGFINETPRVLEKIFYAKWGISWNLMRKEKHERNHFKRARIPCFDDEEDTFALYESASKMTPLHPIKVLYEGRFSSKSLTWLYRDNIIYISHYKGNPKIDHFIKVKSLNILFKASKEICDTITDPNYYYLFNISCFKIAKFLNVTLPGGPRFEPPCKEYRTNINNNLDMVANFSGMPVRVEYRVAFPYLYNNKVMNLPLSQKASPLRLSTRGGSSSAPFFLNINAYPISRILKKKNEKKKALLLPTNFKNLFHELPFYSELLNDALELIVAPKPFDDRKLLSKRMLDVTIEKTWYLEHCPINYPLKIRISYQQLLKHYVLRESKKKGLTSVKKVSVIKIFSESAFFHTTKMDWLEIGIIVCQQGFTMLNLMIHKRGLNFLHLDYNFNLKPIKTLTTKERKKSRFGNAFHLIKEILRITKIIVDLHIQYRLGNIDAYQLSDGIQYTFTHIGTLTGIYRYKYKVMKQIRMCKDLKHLVYYRFNANILGKGPGVGFWFPLWRVWMFFMRGIVPLLELWLGNLLIRQFQGREYNKIPKNVTKQRIESHFDLELKALLLQDFLKTFPTLESNTKINTILQHLSEAWRCWKANIPWMVSKMPEPVETLILRYVKHKADWWTNVTHYNRERIKNGMTLDKTVCRKNIGRLTRLYLKAEQERQHNYLNKGPYLSTMDVVSIYRLLSFWIKINNFSKIKFPSYSYRFGSRILMISLDDLKSQYQVNAKLNMEQKEEMELIEYSYDNSGEILNLIKRQLLLQRSFKEISFEFMDYLDHLVPTYTVNCLEKLVDTFIDHFLWFQLDKINFFPYWMKPSDIEVPPFLVHKWCKGIIEYFMEFSKLDKNTLIVFRTILKDASANMDLSLLNRVLKIMVDINIVDYLTSKNNTYITFKDMTHLNSFGLLRGLQFSTFLISFTNLIIDFTILGVVRAEEIIKNTQENDSFMKFTNKSFQKAHPVKMYLRVNDEIFITLNLTKDSRKTLIEKFLKENTIKSKNKPIFNSFIGLDKNGKKQINNELNKTIIIKAVFWEIKKRIPIVFSNLDWNNTSINLFDNKSNELTLEMIGFSLKFINMHSINLYEATPGSVFWKFPSTRSKLRSFSVKINVNKNATRFFENRIRHMIMTTGTATFTKISNKWNATLIGLITFYREAISSSSNLLEIIVKSENQIHNRVKLGLNTKMPSRFPPVVFYSPKEIGGLGMVSMSHVLIPLSDKKYNQDDNSNFTHYLAGMRNDTNNLIPNILRYITPWENEFRESVLVWLEYSLKKQEALNKKKKISIEDVESYWDKGIPRINTMFQKNRYMLAYEKGWRIRSAFKKYIIKKYNPFWWTSQRHDGKLWNLFKYRTDVIQSLGGLHTMLEHTLFKGTYFPTWEGLFWEKSSGFEETMRFKKLTNAQRSGLNQIPNRRFTLWWSPTINRANIYIGFQVQLDLTGIFMHGKIPTLKVSLIQIFRSHLWQKIHESLVMDICHNLDQQLDVLSIELVQKEIIHPRKSYKMNSSCADIICFATSKWLCSNCTILADNIDMFNYRSSSKLWVDLQLRWGDYDSHDIERYVRTKFIEYTNDYLSIYPCSTGVMIGFDLAYNITSAYGNWIPGLKMIIIHLLSKIIKSNPALYVLRERIRKSLQLYSSESSELNLTTSTYGELFSNQTIWFVDDSNAYRVTIHRTAEGNFTTKPINGCIIVFNPKSGQLFLKILHSSTWDGQRRLSQYSKWKSSEEILTLVQSMPIEERPSKIIVTRKALLDPLEVHFLDNMEISIIGCDLEMPFPSLLKLHVINNIILKGNKSQMVILNMYDDWLSKISSYTAFSRLILILRGIYINYQKTSVVLKLNQKIGGAKIHFWQKFDDDEWIKIEILLKDLILQDYCLKNKIEVTNLTQMEIRDIILGYSNKAVRDIRNQKVEISDSKGTTNEMNTANNNRSVITKNKENEIIVSNVSSQYGSKEFVSLKKWKYSTKKIVIIKSSLKLLKLSIDQTLNSSNKTVVLSRNILTQILSTISIGDEIFCFLLGSKASVLKNIFEIRTLLYPPQIQEQDSFILPNNFPLFKSLDKLIPLGWLHTSEYWNLKILSRNIKYHANMITKFKNWNGEVTVFISLIISSSSCFFKSFSLTSRGFEWGLRQNEFVLRERTDELTIPVSIIISNKYYSFSLIPSNKIWNYKNYQNNFFSKMKYIMKVGLPLAYDDEFHTPFKYYEFNNKLNSILSNNN